MRKVFINPAGQRDNLGDSVLRRPYLDALRKVGPLHVLTGRDEAYVSGLGLHAEDHTYKSRVRWLMAAATAGICARLSFAANAGEYVGTRTEQLKSIWQPVLAAAARITGGQVFLAGASIRPGTDITRTHLPLIARLASVATWRDEASKSAAGRGSVQPDWAFATGPAANDVGAERRRLAVVMRGDRPFPTEPWFASVHEFALKHGLEIWVAVQVHRDTNRALRISQRMNAHYFDWPVSHSHSVHEESLRSFYRTCAFVLSDRIHALIIGATEGAKPVDFTVTGSEKISRTFCHVTKNGVPTIGAAMASPDSSSLDFEALMEDVTHTSAVLAEVSSSIKCRSTGK